MQMNVSTRQLRAFVALAEQRSFTRAAALNHLSQPAFSALIRSMGMPAPILSAAAKTAPGSSESKGAGAESVTVTASH